MEQTKATENLSQWFNLAEQKPWEPGVYEVQYQYGPIGCAYFNGNEFAYGWVIGSREDQMKYALRTANRLDCYQPISWRGLASDPIAKPKPKARGNRKVTKWMVLDVNWTYGKREVACFDTRKQANEFIEYRAKKDSSLKMRAEKIRFRTPEAN